MKPSKETLLNSYIDVKGWSEEDVRKAAEWMAEEVGGYVGCIEVEGDYHTLFIDTHVVKITAKSFLPRSMRHNKLADVSFIFNIEEEPMNTLENLKKAKLELEYAEECVVASKRAYERAYEAFKQEADELLREEDKTAERSSDEGCEEFVAMYKPVDDCFDDLPALTVFNTYKAKTYLYPSGNRYYEVGDFVFDVYAFTKRFQRIS